MRRKVPTKLYWPSKPWEVEAQLRKGDVPPAFVRRMRTINLLSATTLMKMEDKLLAPFDVMDMHHVLDNLISQDAILDQMDSDELSYACTTGNIRPLWDIAPENPLLLKGFTSGWINRFILEPFDPLCVMLAMRAKSMLDLVDEEGHSYNLIRKLGFGFIDFGEIPGEEPGLPGDYYPPEIDNPIDFPPGYVPGPGDPGYVPPGPGDPGYVPPGPGDPGYVPEPGDPGYVPPMPGDPGYVPPAPGEPGYVPGPGDPGYVDPGTTPSTELGGGPGGGAPWGGGIGPGDLGRAVTPGGEVTPYAGDPCADVDDPLLKVAIGYTTQQMSVNEEQTLTVSGAHPRWSYENYGWTIETGGGTLSAEHALELTYTAPATNENCESNPTIALWCGDEIVDTLTIAVNAVEGATRAVMIWKDKSCRTPLAVSYCKAINYTTNCDGSPAPGYPCESAEEFSHVDCEDCFDTVSYTIGCYGNGKSLNYWLDGSPWDKRTTANKLAGCCPEDLI